MMWRDPGIPTDNIYELKPDCGEVPKTRFKIKNGKTLSVRRWQVSFSQEGYLNLSKILHRIQYWHFNCCMLIISRSVLQKGVHPTIRGEVWEFLLGCFDPNSTFEERDQLRQRRRQQYARLKEECREMDSLVGCGRIITAPIITEDGEPIQEPLVLLEASSDPTVKASQPMENRNAMQKITDKKVIQWKLTLHQIGLDVLRTDRALSFYEKKENLSKLWDILAVYAWIDKDVGYGQGMSDLCSPMVVLLEDEADSFWCFERLMRRLRGNFRCLDSSVGVENQLQSLAAVTQIIDPKLHEHIEMLGGGDYLFAFRMLMVLFRREFSFGDSLFLWEMMWALEYDPDIFALYEESGHNNENAVATKRKPKTTRHFGKFERENMKNKLKNSQGPPPISVFLVASVLEAKSSKLLSEARGLDDVVKILNDANGNLDAKKACTNAMKLHKRYLRKAKSAGTSA